MKTTKGEMKIKLKKKKMKKKRKEKKMKQTLFNDDARGHLDNR